MGPGLKRRTGCRSCSQTAYSATLQCDYVVLFSKVSFPSGFPLQGHVNIIAPEMIALQDLMKDAGQLSHE